MDQPRRRLSAVWFADIVGPVLVLGASGQASSLPFEARLARQANDWIVAEMRRIQSPTR